MTNGFGEITVFEHLEDIPQPEHTVGVCKRWERCKQFNIDLGNGYCVQCWDKGYGGGTGMAGSYTPRK